MSPHVDYFHFAFTFVSEWLLPNDYAASYRVEVWLVGIGFVHKRADVYLGILRSSARTQMASERRATEPDW